MEGVVDGNWAGPECYERKKRKGPFRQGPLSSGKGRSLFSGRWPPAVTGEFRAVGLWSWEADPVAGLGVKSRRCLTKVTPLGSGLNTGFNTRNLVFGLQL